MKILSTNVFVGPNIYAHFPVIRHVLDLGELEHWPTGRLGEDFIGPLLEALPGLHEHGCSYKEPGGFVRRLREDEGTWLGHVFEHVALELQNAAGADVTFGKTRKGRGYYKYDNDSHGSPPRNANAGMIVWNGRLPGASTLGWSGSSANCEPRLCNAKPSTV